VQVPINLVPRVRFVVKMALAARRSVLLCAAPKQWVKLSTRRTVCSLQASAALANAQGAALTDTETDSLAKFRRKYSMLVLPHARLLTHARLLAFLFVRVAASSAAIRGLYVAQ
jgi:hypothetical protein